MRKQVVVCPTIVNQVDVALRTRSSQNNYNIQNLKHTLYDAVPLVVTSSCITQVGTVHRTIISNVSAPSRLLGKQTNNNRQRHRTRADAALSVVVCISAAAPSCRHRDTTWRRVVASEALQTNMRSCRHDKPNVFRGVATAVVVRRLNTVQRACCQSRIAYVTAVAHVQPSPRSCG